MIRGNEDADRAAKDALSKAQPENFELPCTDVFFYENPAFYLIFVAGTVG